ncbi:MAG: sigma-70 family RNA polymerase sigma factor [Planctomycetes bacterium]|nr:sigma-70 family RNA polymerase sigma factor [Planctomycetota bacterium]
MTACLQGDPRAQQQLLDRYSGLCRHVASKILGQRAAAYVDDVVQESLAAVFDNLAEWRGQNLPAWIGTIVARRAADHRRRRTRRTEDASGQVDSPTEGSGSPARTEAAPSELVDLLDTLRSSLSDRQRFVLDGILQGKPRQHVADELGISQRTLYYELGEIEQAIEKIRKTSAK